MKSHFFQKTDRLNRFPSDRKRIEFSDCSQILRAYAPVCLPFGRLNLLDRSSTSIVKLNFREKNFLPKRLETLNASSGLAQNSWHSIWIALNPRAANIQPITYLKFGQSRGGI